LAGNFFKAVGVRLVLGLFFVSALMVLLISFFVNVQTNRSVAMLTESTQNHLKTAALAAAKYVTASELDLFHTIEDTENEDYQKLKERLILFAEENNVLYVYYWRGYSPDEGQFIVDNDETQDSVGPGNTFEIEEVALDGLAGNTGATDLGTYTPEWGGLISGYAPVLDEDGNFYCVAGVDISDEFIFIQRRDSRNMTLIQIIALVVSVVSGVFNMVLYRRKAVQIEEAHVKLQYFNNNLRRAFSTYLSEDVVEEIVSDPTRLQLGGVKKHMTAMFTDIKGFSTIAETLSPEHLVDMLNFYLSSMSDIILDQEGTIDKFEGDAIISFFGAPLDLEDHATRACTAAVIMKRMERNVNKHIVNNGLSPTPLLTRIGINTGEMVVGNMGTNKKMNYTIISNAVNLAARLEGVNKLYGTWIITSEDTVKELHGKFLCRKLDRIRVVGINEPVRIYEVIDFMHDAPEQMHERIELFHGALDLFESRRWKEAEGAFKHLLDLYPKDKPSYLYHHRSHKFQSDAPGADWDGVFDMLKK
jgi:class 3 adenylate cyclase